MFGLNLEKDCSRRYLLSVACGTYGGRERCAQGFGGEI